MRKLIDVLRGTASKPHAPEQGPSRKMSHGDLIGELIIKNKERFGRPPVFIETGSGVSTIALAQAASALQGVVYSCDYNDEKVSNLRNSVGNALDVIRFRFGDSLESLRKIIDEHDRIDFVFLDSAASAMHTFREFQIVESRLHVGSVVLIDNAALPNETSVLSPVRKGKILVHYLLASPQWEVRGYPAAGDSMVAAIFHKEAIFADPAYEHPEYVDQWRKLFDKELPR